MGLVIANMLQSVAVLGIAELSCCIQKVDLLRWSGL